MQSRYLQVFMVKCDCSSGYSVGIGATFTHHRKEFLGATRCRSFHKPAVLGRAARSRGRTCTQQLRQWERSGQHCRSTMAAAIGQTLRTRQNCGRAHRESHIGWSLKNTENLDENLAKLNWQLEFLVLTNNC